MSALPWVRFFPSDWLGGTRGLSAAEAGIYITLLANMYERGEPLKEDSARLARLCGASNSVFKAALDRLIDDGKITRVEGGLWNDRVGKEQFYRLEKSEVGKSAAKKRWQKSEQKQCHVDAKAMPTQCEGNANQKPEARVEKEEPNGSSKKARGSRLPDDFQPDMQFATEQGLTPSLAQTELAKFRDYWTAKAGKDATKLDWQATWRNWVRNASKPRQQATAPPHKSEFQLRQDRIAASFDRKIREGNRNEHYDNGSHGPTIDHEPGNWRPH